MFPPFHILAQDADDVVKIVFGVVFAIIWAISGLMSWLNKRHQEARRRRAAEEVAHASRYSAPGLPPVVPQHAPRRGPVGDVAPLPSSRTSPPLPIPTRRISEGLARRHPEVLRPPSPPPLVLRQAPRRPVPPPPLPRMKPQQPQQRRGKKGGRRPQPPAEPAYATLELAGAEDEGPRRPAMTPVEATAIGGAKPRTAAAGSADAAALRQWLTPQTLRSQFILTEILQPPLALRPDRMG